MYPPEVVTKDRTRVARVEVKECKHGVQMATNITFHHGTITPEERQTNLGQKGLTLWLTGLSASGKVRIAWCHFRLRGHNIFGTC